MNIPVINVLWRMVASKRFDMDDPKAAEFDARATKHARVVQSDGELWTVVYSSKLQKKSVTEQLTRHELENALIDGAKYVKQRVSKEFDEVPFGGAVTSFDPCNGEQRADWWHVKFDDGDEEDVDFEELASILVK